MDAQLKTNPTPAPVRVLSLEDIAREKLRCAKRTAYVKVSQLPGFPRPIQIGPKQVRWIEADVDDWLLRAPRRTEPLQEPTQLVSGKARSAGLRALLAQHGYELQKQGSGVRVGQGGAWRALADLDAVEQFAQRVAGSR